MSSKPSPEGVAEVLANLDRQGRLQAEIDELKPAADRLRSAECELSNLQAALTKMFQSMDVASPGNWGFEGRVAWFVRELHRQIKEGAK